MLTLTDGCGEDMDVTPEDDKNADDVSDLSADDDDDNVKEKLAQLQEEENKEVKRSVRRVVNFGVSVRVDVLELQLLHVCVRLV